MYRVNSIWLTLQGEGHWTGRPAVFCRFAGCNLWTGHEKDRASAICTFCDTAFVEYTEYGTADLVDAIEAQWPTNDHRMVVFTGGEPALQLDATLPKLLQHHGFYTAIETNGTKDIPIAYLDWVCVSPKTPKLRVKRGNELKLVYPQSNLDPANFAGLEFDRFWLSPMDPCDESDGLRHNTQAAVEYCLTHPQWRLNIQTHKVIGLP